MPPSQEDKRLTGIRDTVPDQNTLKVDGRLPSGSERRVAVVDG